MQVIKPIFDKAKRNVAFKEKTGQNTARSDSLKMNETEDYKRYLKTNILAAEAQESKI